MARIRSVHPGFFTDEDIVSVSMAARLLIIGLGVEADDKGIFEWKPLTIKMKVFPADSLDISTLLDELVSVDAILAYEIAGRKYGAIRNFRKHQRPKTPNDLFPATPEALVFVGLDTAASETMENHFRSVSEIAPQMEDGGGRGIGGEKGKSDDDSANANDWPDLDFILTDLQASAGLTPAEWQGHTAGVLLSWRNSGFSYRLDVIPTVKAVSARMRHAPKSWAYFTDSVAQACADRTKVIPLPDAQAPPQRRGYGPADGEVNAAIRKALG